MSRLAFVCLTALFLSCSAPQPPSAVAIPTHPRATAPVAPLPIASAPAASPAARCQDVHAARALTRYPFDSIQSPMTAAVIERLSSVLRRSKGRRNVFMKVGDSMTISNHFLKCFAEEDHLELGAYTELEATRRFFQQVQLGPPKTSFDRASLATHVGWTAPDPRRGHPSPLDKEIAGTRPAFAIIMFGSNGSSLDGVDSFERDLLADIDVLLQRGIIPLMSTVPPKIGKPESMAAIPEMNAVVRAIAQARQVPFMDYYAALQHLPDYGLSEDGVHPRPYVVGHQARGCWLNEPALRSAMNVRNLLVLTSLDRVRRFLLEHEAPEPEPAPLAGDGSADCPVEVSALPFVDVAAPLLGAATGDSAETGSQTDCAAGEAPVASNSYVVRVDKPTRLSIRLFGEPGADLRLAWNPSQGSCLSGAGRELLVEAEPGRHILRAGASQGLYRLTIVERGPEN